MSKRISQHHDAYGAPRQSVPCHITPAIINAMNRQQRRAFKRQQEAKTIAANNKGQDNG